jgi:hypothetical protein
VIQVSQLQEPCQSEIEQLLAIFDQHKHLPSDEHILEIDEKIYPAKYRSIIRRLQQAIAEPEIRKTMDGEDEILEDLQNMERLIEEQNRALEEKNQALEEKDKIIAQLQHLLDKSQ